MLKDDKSADVIIVGGGHNGLIAACYLARAGVDVLVVEAFGKMGGMTATSPMAPEAPDHLINEGSIQASLFNATSIDRELELSSKYGLQNVFIDPFHVHLGPEGESLAFWKDYRKTAEEIRYFSPKDAANWLKLCHTIDRAVSIGLPIMKIRNHDKKSRFMTRHVTSANMTLASPAAHDLPGLWKIRRYQPGLRPLSVRHGVGSASSTTVENQALFCKLAASFKVFANASKS